MVCILAWFWCHQGCSVTSLLKQNDIPLTLSQLHSENISLLALLAALQWFKLENTKNFSWLLSCGAFTDPLIRQIICSLVKFKTTWLISEFDIFGQLIHISWWIIFKCFFFLRVKSQFLAIFYKFRLSFSKSLFWPNRCEAEHLDPGCD